MLKIGEPGNKLETIILLSEKYSLMKVVLNAYYDYNDNIFNYSEAKKVIGGTWMALLYTEAAKNGIEVILAKKYLSNGIFSSEDLIISEGYTQYTTPLLNTGAKPFIIYSGESPNVDWLFYSSLKKYTKAYSHAILFSGTAKFIPEHTKFHQFFWPNESSVLPTHGSLENKEKLVMVVSNKKQSSTTNTASKLRFIKKILLKFMTRFVPSLKLKDLYSLRMNAIVYFSDKPYFKLYGKGWNEKSNLTQSEVLAIEKLNPQTVENKSDTIKKFQLALCFENCVYPGYITEKIFDCFLADCVPVYYGAPDIEKYVPANTFINANRFKNFHELEQYIQSLTIADIQSFLNNKDAYLRSENYKKFTDKFLADYILKVILDERSLIH